MPDSERDAARQRFLRAAGCATAQVTPLPPDASSRRYSRVRDGERACMLMDAPPPEDVRAFVAIARHLDTLGLRVPAIYNVDAAAGFVLLEDLGDATFTRLLDDGADERELYAQAVDTLVLLHTRPDATDVAAPPYDAALLVEEVVRMIDWYYPGVTGGEVPPAVRGEFADLWRALLAALPPLAPTLVLRDFHVDNLMRVISADGTAQCGLLDFQDAVIGSPAYDLMSLLEDARRALAPQVAVSMLARYHTAARTADRSAFGLHFHALAAQRHCKVLGNFARLARRDGKRRYLAHIPRVVALLQHHLDEPLLRPLREWLDHHLPMRHTAQVAAR